MPCCLDPRQRAASIFAEETLRMTATETTVWTSHADIAIRQTEGEGVPILLIHGNSSCKEAFREQFDGPLGRSRRLIAMDLPGHGASSDAFDPHRSYSMPAYAECAVELLQALGIDRAAVFGWSLGGHVALEMLPRFPGMLGLMIAGTPPVRPTVESIQAGFRPNPLVGIFGKRDFTPDEVEAFGAACYGPALDDGFREALRRTDGRARELMFSAIFTGGASDQRLLAEECGVPLAIVNGAEDPLVDVDYIGRLSYRSLWEQHCHLLRDQGHAFFLTAPERFNPILARFAADMDKEAARPFRMPAAKVAAA
jgi:pimeloyl-ACP methyl ester carboxylesterase